MQCSHQVRKTADDTERLEWVPYDQWPNDTPLPNHEFHGLESYFIERLNRPLTMRDQRRWNAITHMYRIANVKILLRVMGATKPDDDIIDPYTARQQAMNDVTEFIADLRTRPLLQPEPDDRCEKCE